jgi:signal transduction histidine kinase
MAASGFGHRSHGGFLEGSEFHPRVDNRLSAGGQTKEVLIVDNRLSRWLSAGGIAILVLIEYDVVRRHPGSRLEILLPTAVAIIAWLTLIAVYRQEQPLLRMVTVGVLGVSAVGLALGPSEGAGILPAIVAIAASTRLPSPAGEAIGIGVVAAYVLATGIALGWQPISLLSYALGLSFAFIAARSTTRLRNEQVRTKALLLEVQRNRDAQVEAAALNERARIAREIHDVLAHTLAALTVQLEGARVSLQQRATDPEALAGVERAHHLAREGLNETRRAVSALRGDEIPGPERIQKLVSDFQSDTGTAAELRIIGTVRPLPAEAQLAIFRTAQEALTNVRKHARATRVDLLLRYAENATELVIADHGERTTGEISPGGYGLLGMRERAELLGGSLDAQPTGDGFSVSLRIPG